MADVHAGQITDETIGWIGERYDADAGLQYLNARYYDPALGLFIQPDWFEVTEPGVGTNRYSYSFNDPVNLRDPGGNQTQNQGRPGNAGPSLFGGARSIKEALALLGIAAREGILGDNGQMGPPGSATSPVSTIGQSDDEVFNSEDNAGSKTKDGQGEKSSSTGSGGDPNNDDDEDGYNNDDEPSSERNNRKGKPGDNKRQNQSFNDALKEISRRIGRRISRSEQRSLHDEITGQDYSYHDIVETGVDMFGDHF